MACQALLYWMAQHNRLVYHCAIAAAAVVAGCDTVKTAKHPDGSGGSTVSVQFDRAEFERQRESYRREAEVRVAKFEEQLAELGRKADNAAGDAKVQLKKEWAEQQVNLARAKQELKEIDVVVGEKWADFERRSSKALDDLHDGFSRAFARFRD